VTHLNPFHSFLCFDIYFAARSRPAPRAAPVRNPPQPARQAPPPAPAQNGGGSILGGIGSTIAQGMAFGTGSAMAHRAVDAVMGPRTIQHETVVSEAAASATPMANATPSDSCSIHSKAFQDVCFPAHFGLVIFCCLAASIYSCLHFPCSHENEFDDASFIYFNFTLKTLSGILACMLIPTILWLPSSD
jgi:hypothetical protein